MAHLCTQGDSANLHAIHWHGNVVRDQGRHTDSVRALSGTTRSLDLIADNPGTWLFHCHVRPRNSSFHLVPLECSSGQVSDPVRVCTSLHSSVPSCVLY